MISFLIGQPVLETGFVTVLVGGVGYAVHVTEKLRHVLANVNETRLHIHTHFRADTLELYGFETLEQRRLFQLLLGVSGVGPKTALGLLNMGAAELIHAVQHADTAAFSGVPRVGKKLAQKIIIELRTKLGELQELDLAPLTTQQTELAEALQSLGFDEGAVHTLVRDTEVQALSLEAAIKFALKKI